MITKEQFLSGQKFKDNYFNIIMKYSLLTNDVITLNTLNELIFKVVSVNENGFILDKNLHGKDGFRFDELIPVEE